MLRKHPLARCEECPLQDEDLVPTRFSPGPTTLVVVGEAPGYQEAKYGRPFVGPSGQLLKRVLRHWRYTGKEVTLTNVTLCHPPNNATPPKAAIAACRPRLLAELSESGARDVIALGGTATNALVDDPGTITKLRIGPPKLPTHPLRGTSIERVVPTWHTAYCLRNADAFPSLVTDFGKLRDVKRESWCEPEWEVADDPADALLAIRELQLRADTLVVDIEVGFDKDEQFGHPNEYDLLCVGIAYARGKVIVLGESGLRDREVLDRLGELLRTKRLSNHNIKFDQAGLFPLLGPLEGSFDTMLSSYCFDERPGQHSLETLSVEKLGSPSWKNALKQYIPKGGSYADVPRPILYRYCALDVGNTWLLMELFEAKFEADEPFAKKIWPYPDRPVKTLRDVHDLLVSAANQLMYLELNGVPVDRKYNNELTYTYLDTLEKIEDQLDDIVRGGTGGGEAEEVTGSGGGVVLPDSAGEAGKSERSGTTSNEGTSVTSGDKRLPRLNPRSPKQIREYLESEGIRVASTDADTIAGLLKRVEPDSRIGQFLRTLLVHRKEQKLYGTYVKGIRKRLYRGRVYTTYLLHGSTSGRLASRNPNLQNIVRNKSIRRQFTVSRPEHVFVHADFKQAEGRVIAYLARDEYLREILCDPTRDIFDDLSDQLYGRGKWRKEVERIRTKAFFYGISYGRESYSIAMEFGLSVSEAERTYRRFMNLIPATAKWQEATKERVLSGEDLVTPFGRRRRFALITDQNKKEVLNEALSFLPQSTASDICLRSLIRVRPMLRGLGWLRLTIHDALVAECPESKVEEVSNLLRDTMVQEGLAFTDYVPFPVDCTVGKTWGDL